MTIKHDIHVSFSVIAKDEKEAEEKLQNFLKDADHVINDPDIEDWEYIEFIPAELSKSCCC